MLHAGLTSSHFKNNGPIGLEGNEVRPVQNASKNPSMMYWPRHLSSLQSGVSFLLIILSIERKNDFSIGGGEEFLHQVNDTLITTSLDDP